MKRFGMITGLKPEMVDTYSKLHQEVWPGVLKTISKCNIQNYSIYLQQLPSGENLLFSYFEYSGSDFSADMARMAADPETQEWWKLCTPCQEALDEASLAGAWIEMKELFHYD